MKRIFLHSFVFHTFLVLLALSCSKPTEFTDYSNPYDEQSEAFISHPDLITLEVDSIRAFEAWSGGEFTNDYGSPVTAKGVCWSTRENPTTDDNCTNDGDGLEAFESHISDLEPDQQYYVRAYSTNENGTLYANQLSFTTELYFSLTINIEGEGDVRQEIIQSKTISDEYPFETLIRLTAEPKSGWEFSNWSGFKNSNDRVIDIQIDDNITLDVLFKKIPIVETLPVTKITYDGALAGGKVTSDSNVEILDKGICWSTTPGINPETHPDYQCRSENPGAGTFERTIGNLEPSTRYYVNAYAAYNINTDTYAMGNERSFTTNAAAELPTVSTLSISSITSNSAISGGNVANDGGATVTQRGVCWNNSPNPTLQNNLNCTNQGSGTGSFSTELTGLEPLNNYWVRAYATNSQGTVYGNEVSFTTLRGGGSDDGGSVSLPTVSTTAINSITTDSAISGGNVTSDGGAAVTARGVCWSTSQNPTTSDNCTSDGTGKGSFTSTISNLNASTTYYVRAFATNEKGTSYGNQVNLTTEAEDDDGSDGDDADLPTVSTTAISSITTDSAISGGNVTSDGGAAVTQRGICWNNSPNPTLQNNLKCTQQGSGTGSFSTELTGLIALNNYWVRAYATNSQGTTYGNEVSFTTLRGSN